jgi:hypothetical protein
MENKKKLTQMETYSEDQLKSYSRLNFLQFNPPLYTHTSSGYLPIVLAAIKKGTIV